MCSHSYDWKRMQNDPRLPIQIKTVWRWSTLFRFLHRVAFELEWLQNLVLNFWFIVSGSTQLTNDSSCSRAFFCEQWAKIKTVSCEQRLRQHSYSLSFYWCKQALAKDSNWKCWLLCTLLLQELFTVAFASRCKVNVAFALMNVWNREQYLGWMDNKGWLTSCFQTRGINTSTSYFNDHWKIGQ